MVILGGLRGARFNMIWGCVCEGVSWGRLTLEPATQETDGPPHEIGLTQPTEGLSRTTGKGGRNPPGLWSQGLKGDSASPLRLPSDCNFPDQLPWLSGLCADTEWQPQLDWLSSLQMASSAGDSPASRIHNRERQCLPKAHSSQHTSRRAKVCLQLFMWKGIH